MSDTRNTNLAIISEMESARYARHKVERGAKGEADLKWVKHTKTSRREPCRKNLRGTISEGGSLSDYRAIYECAGIKLNAGPC